MRFAQFNLFQSFSGLQFVDHFLELAGGFANAPEEIQVGFTDGLVKGQAFLQQIGKAGNGADRGRQIVMDAFQ